MLLGGQRAEAGLFASWTLYRCFLGRGQDISGRTTGRTFLRFPGSNFCSEPGRPSLPQGPRVLTLG